METVRITPAYDAAIAKIIRDNLRAYGLDIPGTAYYDEGLDRLSEYYSAPGRAYFVLLDGGDVLGGVGLAGIGVFPDCAELQKLYLADRAKGRGLGSRLLTLFEREAAKLGYRRAYLETHTNLSAALRLYEKHGYTEIARPASVVHGTMNKFYFKEL